MGPISSLIKLKERGMLWGLKIIKKLIVWQFKYKLKLLLNKLVLHSNS